MSEIRFRHLSLEDQEKVRQLGKAQRAQGELCSNEEAVQLYVQRVGEDGVTLRAESVAADSHLHHTHDELIADRAALDHVLQAICLNAGVTYLEALDCIDDWFSQAGEHRTEPPTLRQALERNFQDPSAYRRSAARRLHDVGHRARGKAERRRSATPSRGRRAPPE
jgi:hypothetical protein